MSFPKRRIIDDEFGNTFLRRFGFEMLSVVVSFVLVVWGWGHWSPTTWAGFGGFVLTSMIAGHRIKYFTYKYTCPECGRRASRRPGSRVAFDCMACDVEYVTRMRDEG